VRRKRQKESRLILVLGGAASGKSKMALDLAGQAEPRAFVATGQALDREMKVRIERHQASRSPDWETAEVPADLAGWFAEKGHNYQTIVLDCLTLWLSNIDGKHPDGLVVTETTTKLLQTIRATGARVVVVSNELGLGLVPVTKTVRAFRDLAGLVNQQVAAEADEVYLAVSGLPLRVK